MPGDKTRWGILGTGRMAQSFASALLTTEHSQLVAIGSRSKSSAESFAREFNVPRPCSSYEALAKEDQIDVIYIATPHSVHEKNVLMCLEAGKAVLCEKPLTLNAAQAEKIINCARAKNLFIMEAMWTRFIPAVIKLNELIAEGAIGNVQLLLAGGAFMPELDMDNYLFNPELGGGVLLDAGVYLVSMASMLFGKPLAIKALAQKACSGVDEHDAVLLEHASGALACLYVSLRAQSSPDMRVLGSKGTIYLSPPVFAPPSLKLELYNGESEQIDLPFSGNGYQFEIDEVHRCLQNNLKESEHMPLEESLEIMRTMDAIRKQINLSYPGE